MNSHPLTAAKQRGMAIISALLIAAVVAVIAGGMLTRQTIFTRSLEAEQQRVEGAWLLHGGVELSRQLLMDAWQRDPLTRLDQAWAQPIFAPALSNRTGPFDGRLEDEQGKFNLRNLVADDRVDEEQLLNFERLCQSLEINPAVSQRISQRVISAYPRLLHPERADQAALSPGFDSGRGTSPDAARKPEPAKRPMLRSLDDLRSVEGVTDDVLARLAPYMTILPALTWINGNTASALVLAANVPGLSLQRAQALVAERDSGQWFINRGDFVNRLRMPKATMDTIRIGITSDWFRLHGRARSQQRQVSLDALLYRAKDALPQVIWSRVGV
ncbi:type II secretion system minor pseudopilin GspK [Pseudomonas syringae]|nr:type II secretion system minor pseudopilin GspK [Pseudomonas syringae]MCQ3001079.1 type II secretion system minor pseudopilin GspK [Pseudomonas syringae]MCQ3031109.1 type II secretion system minor pseudopilin GspK [Pseudomonas syringae]MDG6398965.1 type II secretion system minor pseudopilin GspK [Pseudomonas quasicaspiana]